MIPIMWWEPSRMSYSCCNMLNEMLDRYPCAHYDRANRLPYDADGCVLVFHGGNLSLAGLGDKAADMLLRFIGAERWAILISVGDEAAEFPYHILRHPRIKLWVQAPISTTKADRYLVQGYPAHTTRRDIPKVLDWFFAGQDTHERRHSCIAALEPMSLESSGLLLTTQHFGAGLLQLEYLTHMSRARLAPCPAGPATVDTFRVYEALECGAIPILDSRSLRDSTVGVWPLLLGDHPLPVIEDWSTLPDVMATWLVDWESKSRWIQLWWRSYKNDFNTWLARDLLSLGVSNGRKEEASASATPTPATR